MTDFEEYIRQGEPSKREKAYAWRTAIGLQAVDGLTTSDYLKETARRHIEGEIDIDEAQRLIKTYYQSKLNHEPDDDEKQEADKVSSNIAKILNERSFTFSVVGITSLHRRIFEGVFKFAGKVRDYDITKKEWVLEGDTVLYTNADDIRRALEYDLEQEHEFSYAGISNDTLVRHLTRFVSGLWQIHPFGEGNTRTTAVFTIKYLRSIGFDADNDLFAEHAWYFRNALVRANYKNAQKDIDYTPIYLERFFRNLLLGEQWELRSRYLHIHPTEEWSVQPNHNTPTSTPASTPTSTEQIRVETSPLETTNENVLRLISVVGNAQMSIREMLSATGLKDRKNFIEYSLSPAIQKGFVTMLYPDKPRHPRQKYLLTPKGLELWAKMLVKD